MPQSHATAMVPRAPSGRATSFHPVPLHKGQFSNAMANLSAGLLFILRNEGPGVRLRAHSIRARVLHGKRLPAGILWKDCTKTKNAGKDAGATNSKAYAKKI
jgi:hypothetical protein